MKNVILMAVAIILVMMGYFIKHIEVVMQPNYRWVRISNETGCDIKLASIVLGDRTVSVVKEQNERTAYLLGGERYDVYIPLLVKEKDEFHAEFIFNDCDPIIGEIEYFRSGHFTDIDLNKDRIGYRAR